MRKQKVLHRCICVCLAVLLLLAVPVQAEDGASKTMVNVDQVLIYNPNVDPDETRSTGDMTGQIGTSLVNYSLLPQEEPPRMDLVPMLPELQLAEAAVTEAEMPETEVKVGDQRAFHYLPYGSYHNKTPTFTCLYASDACLIWGYQYDESETAKILGDRFTKDIQPLCEQEFGTGRFLQDGEKLNILIYPLSNYGYLGFFVPDELLTVEEKDKYSNYLNKGMPVIHINANHAKPENYKEYCEGTIAHEFQHLICMSSMLLGNGYEDRIEMEIWINEAMSQYAAELIDSGYMERNGYVTKSYNNSGLIANGQSLYDFGTNGDVGVYGQVYLFARYLQQHRGTGSSVFQAMHTYWRTAAAGDLTTAKMLQAVLNRDGFQTDLAEELSAVELEDPHDTFLSRLNLAFQIAMVLEDGTGIYQAGAACAEAAPRVCTKTTANVDGGGRILVNTADGDSYTFPADAHPELIYVGFQDGRITVPPTTAADYCPVPDDVFLRVIQSDVSEETRIVTYEIGLPVQTDCVLVAAAYDSATGQMGHCVVQPLELEAGRWKKTVTLPDGGSIWKFFLLQNQVPMLEQVVWEPAKEVE